MKIEVLYVPDCPHHPAAILKLKEVLAAEGVAAGILEVAVNDMATAKALRFCGSPTILINGRDVAAELGNSQEFAVSCRLYPGSEAPGVPPAEMIRRAVRDARGGQSVKEGAGISASVGAILSSLASLSCCLPLGFAAALGAGAASAFFMTLRPWMLGLSVVLIGLGFWQQRRATQCAVKGRVVGQVLLWAAVVVVLGMILFPQQIAGFLADRLGEAGK